MSAQNQVETEVKYLMKWNENIKNKIDIIFKKRFQFYVNAGDYNIRVSYRNDKYLMTLKIPVQNSISNYEIETEITEEITREFFKNSDRFLIKEHGCIELNGTNYELEFNIFKCTENNIMDEYVLLEVEMENDDNSTLEIVNNAILKQFENESIYNVTNIKTYSNYSLAKRINDNMSFDELLELFQKI